MILLPQTKPIEDQAALWALQNELLKEAERLLGIRDLSKKVYQPVFKDDGPQIRLDHDGAFVELGRKCESDWSFVVFQMAHETVHLLNPGLLGRANNLEEGIAVAFSLKVQQLYNINIRIAALPYRQANQLVCMLPGDPFEAGRRVRDRCGSLSNVTVQQLEEMFPDVDKITLIRLAERFAGGDVPI